MPTFSPRAHINKFKFPKAQWVVKIKAKCKVQCLLSYSGKIWTVDSSGCRETSPDINISSKMHSPKNRWPRTLHAGSFIKPKKSNSGQVSSIIQVINRFNMSVNPVRDCIDHKIRIIKFSCHTRMLRILIINSNNHSNNLYIQTDKLQSKKE